jgi:tetratricopeptide (TPR) repeat protein
MNRFATRFFLLIFPSLFAASAWAQSSTARVEETAARSGKRAPGVAPVPQQLFGTITLTTRSEEARKLVELSIDKYENAMYADAVTQAQRATEKDPQSALGYAMLSFSARRGIPDLSALAKAKSLLIHATPDEQMLVRWMTSIQDRDLLPAIVNMNDLLKRYPRDKHILYLTGEWLFLQQDDERARKVMESALQVDANFPAVLNRLGYLYVENGDPARAIASLKRYAEVEPHSPNPEDSLGEVLRTSGDDQGSLQHYAAALKIDPTYLASQTGLGDTRTLMGDFKGAREEYDRALKLADNPRDELYTKAQKALVFFWEGHPAEGHAALATLAEQAAKQKEPNSQFEIGLERAMLTSDPADELKQLGALSVFLEKPLAGMLESDRNVDGAAVLRERVRIAASNGLAENAAEAISKLKELATTSRDPLVQDAYESARGYLLFAQGDLAGAAEGLAADSHSPLVLQQSIATQVKLGNTPAAQSARTHLKYHRGPVTEWYLVTRSSAAGSH